MHIKTLIACAAALVMTAGTANAALIGSFSSLSGGSIGPDATDSVKVIWGFGLAGSDPFAPPASLVDEFLTVDTSYSITSGVEFDEAVVFLTDGSETVLTQANLFYFMGVRGGGFGGNTSVAEVFGLMTPDFQGLVITEIVFTIMNLETDFGPNGGEFFYNFRIDIYDASVAQVPLPAAAPLFMVGIAGFGFLRRRRKA